MSMIITAAISAFSIATSAHCWHEHADDSKRNDDALLACLSTSPQPPDPQDCFDEHTARQKLIDGRLLECLGILPPSVPVVFVANGMSAPAPAADPCMAQHRREVAEYERLRDECRAANPGSTQCDTDFNNRYALSYFRLRMCQNPWPIPGGI